MFQGEVPFSCICIPKGLNTPLLFRHPISSIPHKKRLGLVITRLESHPRSYDFDTHGSLRTADVEVKISKAGSGSGSVLK